MPSKERYRELLEGVRDAHAEHRRAYQKARSELGTNRKAHEVTREQLKTLNTKLNLFYETVLGPLAEPFLAGDCAAIEEVLNFLEVDVPAFRTGYSKEWYYRKLKALKLNSNQVERLREIAINRVVSAEYRREDSELRRLMIKLADLAFLVRIAELPDRANPHVKRKKSLMFRVIVNGRKDLRKEVEDKLLRTSN